MASNVSSDVTTAPDACTRSPSADNGSNGKEPVSELGQSLVENLASLFDGLTRGDPPNEARHGFRTTIDEGQQRQPDADTATTGLWSASTGQNPERYRTEDTGPEQLVCRPTCITSQVTYPDNNYRPVVRGVRRVFSAPSALGRYSSTFSAQASQYLETYANHPSFTPYLSSRDRVTLSNFLHNAYRTHGPLTTSEAILNYCPLCGRESPKSVERNASKEGGSQTHMSKAVGLRLPLCALQVWSSRGIRRASTAQTGLAPTEVLAEHNRTRSDLADTAITHTNVHGIAISPNLPTTLPFGDEGLYDVTSQVIESGKSIYRVVWDEANICSRPDDSSASTCSTDDPLSDDESQPAYTRREAPWVGLDRVNTKLAAWSWKRAPHTLQETETDNDDEYEESGDTNGPCSNVPPNSERPSQVSSRLPSRPPSDRIRFGPVLATGSDSDRRDLSDQLESLGNLDAGTDAKIVYNTSTELEGVRIEGRSRILSNLSLLETHFAGHRDSVAMARRRMKKRPYKSSTARDVPCSQDATGGTLSPIADSSPPPWRVIASCHTSLADLLVRLL